MKAPASIEAKILVQVLGRTYEVGSMDLDLQIVADRDGSGSMTLSAEGVAEQLTHRLSRLGCDKPCGKA